MEESHIKKIAVLCSIIGLVILYFTSSITRETVISDLSIEDIGMGVRICGSIQSRHVSNNHIFFTLTDETGSIDVVIFNTTALEMNESGSNLYTFSIGDDVCIPGIIDEYPKNSGEIEMIYRQGVIEKFV